MPKYQVKNIDKNIKIGVWKITETLENLIFLLKNTGFDTSKVIVTKNKQRLKQWLAVRLLLNDFFKDAKITYDDLGKPYLDNAWFISISHANEFVAIIINKDKYCGVDIEKVTPKVERIKHKFLNPSDLKNVTSLENLTIYWSAKEALYKYYGKKEVLFIEHLFIEGFDENEHFFKGLINMPNFKIEIPIVWEKIEDFVLVYTL